MCNFSKYTCTKSNVLIHFCTEKLKNTFKIFISDVFFSLEVPCRLAIPNKNIGKCTNRVYIIECNDVDIIKCTQNWDRHCCIYISSWQVALKSFWSVWLTTDKGKSNILWQTWVGGALTIAPVMLIWTRLVSALRSACLCFVATICVELCDPQFGLRLHYLFINCATLVSQTQRKAARGTQRQVLQAAS